MEEDNYMFYIGFVFGLTGDTRVEIDEEMVIRERFKKEIIPIANKIMEDVLKDKSQNIDSTALVTYGGGE